MANLLHNTIEQARTLKLDISMFARRRYRVKSDEPYCKKQHFVVYLLIHLFIDLRMTRC